MVFQKSLGDSKSSKVSRTPLSILVDLNRAVVWTVSTYPLISKSSSTFTKPLEIGPSAPITIGITVIFMFHFFFFFNVLARSKYLSLFSTFFYFHSVVCQNGKDHCSADSLFFLFLRFLFVFLGGGCIFVGGFFYIGVAITGLVVWPKLDDSFVSQNPREVCASHFPERILGYACPHGQLSVSCTIPSRSLSPPNRIYSYTLFVLTCCIRLLCD